MQTAPGNSASQATWQTVTSSLQVEEFYVITWDAKKEQIFEMPTGGAAIMRQGPNLLKLSRKEQCLALLTQLRTKFKTNGCFYRVFPNGEVQYLHPKDGVYPEKVNKGREGVNLNMRRIGQVPNPVEVRIGCSLAQVM
jgi:photosystem I subunit II